MLTKAVVHFEPQSRQGGGSKGKMIRKLRSERKTASDEAAITVT